MAERVSPRSARLAKADLREERREPTRQHPVLGGHRSDDPPLTVERCAFLLNAKMGFIRDAIDHGHEFKGRRIYLRAEKPKLNGKRFIRVYREDFLAFLTAIEWSRIPPDLLPSPDSSACAASSAKRSR